MPMVNLEAERVAEAYSNRIVSPKNSATTRTVERTSTPLVSMSWLHEGSQEGTKAVVASREYGPGSSRLRAKL